MNFIALLCSTLFLNSSINANELQCPKNYTKISSNKVLHTKEFCVAKFEAKKSKNNIAISSPSDPPWVNITRKTARDACLKNGTHYDLISNKFWQAIGQEIENNKLNWSSNIIGVGFLNNGHSDNLPETVNAIPKNEPCLTQADKCHLLKWSQNRRFHFLKYGDVIWDFAGNAWEFVKDDAPKDLLKILPQDFGSYGNASRFKVLRTQKVINYFGPILDVKSWDQGYGFIGKVGEGPVMVRGGNNDDFFMSGIYSAGVGAPLDVTHEAVGFRCIYTE